MEEKQAEIIKTVENRLGRNFKVFIQLRSTLPCVKNEDVKAWSIIRQCLQKRNSNQSPLELLDSSSLP